MFSLTFNLDKQWEPLTIEMHRMIRHHPIVAAYLLRKANECQSMAGDNFETGVQNRKGTTRARAWIRPANPEGIQRAISGSMRVRAEEEVTWFDVCILHHQLVTDPFADVVQPTTHLRRKIAHKFVQVRNRLIRRG